jgi:CHAP domain
MSVESVLQRVATLEQALANPATLLGAAARTGGTAAPAALSQVAPEAGSAGGGSFAEALQSASAGYRGSGSAGAGAVASATSPAATAGANPTLAGTADAALGLTASASAAPGAGTSVSDLGALTPTLSSAAPGTSTGARIVAIAESQVGQAEQPLGSNESPAIAQYRTATAGAIPGAPWCAYFASWAAREAGAPLGAHGEGLGAVSEIWSWAQSTGRAIANGPGVVPQPGDLIVFGDEHVGIVKDVLPNGDIQTIEGNYENKVAQNVRAPSEATGYVNMN